MKKIEVYGSIEDNSMLIKIDGWQIHLTAAEAAYLDSMMAQAYADSELAKEHRKAMMYD